MSAWLKIILNSILVEELLEIILERFLTSGGVQRFCNILRTFLGILKFYSADVVL